MPYFNPNVTKPTLNDTTIVVNLNTNHELAKNYT